MKLKAPYIPEYYPEADGSDVMLATDPKFALACAEGCVFSRKDVDDYDYRTIEHNINLVQGQMLTMFAKIGWCFILQANGLVKKEELTYSY